MKKVFFPTLLPFAVASLLFALNAARGDGRLSGWEVKSKASVDVSIRYLLSLPKGYDDDKQKKWPLVLFLHGSGESGNDLEKVKIHGPPKLVEAGKEFPFILVAPQAPRLYWQYHKLKVLLDDVQTTHRVDLDRVYVTGLSMGGHGTWGLAAEYPDRFAAIVPICGRGYAPDAARIKHIPVWTFHGDKDKAVPVGATKRMVKALEEVGADVQFTLYPDTGHDSWTKTYDNPKLYEWLLSHRRKR